MVQITDEDIGPSIIGLFLLIGVLQFELPVVELDLLQGLDGVLCVQGSPKLNEAVAEMIASDFISLEVDGDHRTDLDEEFPKQLFSDPLINVRDQEHGFGVLLNQTGLILHE